MEMSLISGHEINNISINNDDYIVKDIIRGSKVSILTGGSKTGKSTLALQLTNAVSKGIPFLNKETHQGQVLYLCMDNEIDLIAERLKLMNIELTNDVKFCFDKSIVLHPKDINTDGLLDIIVESLDSLPYLSLVIVDLFDNIRELNINTESNNVKDTEDIEELKNIATLTNTHILALNHDTKSGTQNGYSSTKGGVKFVGSINGAYLHLIREGIGSTDAVLEIGGRNAKEDRINLLLNTENLTYSLEENNIDENMPYEVGIIRNFLIRNNGFEGTITKLLQLTNLTIAANKASRLLMNCKDLLALEGINFYKKPGHKNGRIIVFEIEKEDDEDDGDD